MTPSERQQSLINARNAIQWLRDHMAPRLSEGLLRGQVQCLIAEFERLDANAQRMIERNQNNSKNAGRPRSKKPSPFALAKRKSRAKAKQKKSE